MKRLISTFLIIITILALSVSVFADGEIYKCVGSASLKSVSVGEEVTVTFALTNADGSALTKYNMTSATNTVGINFNNDSFELVELPKFLYGYTVDAGTSTPLDKANNEGTVIINGSADVDFAFTTAPIFSATFRVKDTAAANSKLNLTDYYFNFVDGDGEWELMGDEVAFVFDDVTVKAPAPAQTPISPVASTEIKVGNTTYTDVVNFASSVSGSGAKLSFDLFENGTKHGNTYSVNLADWGLTIEEGTLNFKVAIIGAPSTGVTMNNITLGN